MTINEHAFTIRGKQIQAINSLGAKLEEFYAKVAEIIPQLTENDDENERMYETLANELFTKDELCTLVELTKKSDPIFLRGLYLIAIISSSLKEADNEESTLEELAEKIVLACASKVAEFNEEEES